MTLTKQNEKNSCKNIVNTLLLLVLFYIKKKGLNKIMSSKFIVQWKHLLGHTRVHYHSHCQERVSSTVLLVITVAVSLILFLEHSSLAF